MKKIQTKESGFTIIEVVLVLAIAGLIFLVVFLALPALQRSQRDSQRRSDAGRFMAQLESYASNNNGDYPDASEVGAFVDNYLTDDAEFSDPQNDPDSDGEYEIVYGTSALDVTGVTNLDDTDNVYYQRDSICGDSEGIMLDGTGNRSVAVIIPLENGISYCQDNR